MAELDLSGYRVGKRVKVQLPACPYTRRQAGTFRGTVEYIKGDHVGIWVPQKGHGAAGGFLTGAARIDADGVWIEGR
ncbi:hypothetical protein ACIQ6V_15485 [Streptomyces sp. NPDC096198]|uniref:hypothetical protein n=1 Tax=Streptomyces sp. NPDC096198 TaxID=3366080 RepID=UPI0038210D03